MKFSTIFKGLFMIFIGILLADMVGGIIFKKKSWEQTGPSLGTGQTPFKNIQLYQDTPMDMPPLVFQTIDGNKISLTDMKGKYVVLNIWATWCTPCVEELPALQNLQKTLQPEGWSVLAVSVDYNPQQDQINQFVEKYNVRDVAGFYDDIGTLQEMAMQVGGVPLTYILSPEGKIIARVNGSAVWDSSEIISYLQTLTQ